MGDRRRGWQGRCAGAWLAGVALLALGTGAQAADKLRVGKASSSSIMMSPLDVGIAKGIFAAHGLEIDEIAFNGSAKVHQGMAAGALDIVIAAGPDLAYVAKGAPEIGVGAISDVPDLGFIVPYDSPLKTIDDLKGKRIGISTKASLTDWLAGDLAKVKGWGPDGVVPVVIGNQIAGEIAAMRTGQVDTFIETSVLGIKLERSHEGKLLAPVSSYVTDLVANAIFASNDLVKTKPEAVKAFLAAWYETIAFIRSNKDEAVPLIAKVTGYDVETQRLDYDLAVPNFSTTGRISQKTLDLLADSFVELKILKSRPDTATLYTSRFLPSGS